MGASCCKKETDRIDDIDNCKDISEIRNYISSKIESAELEQEEINAYLEDKDKVPSSIEITGFNEEDLKKRILYLDEMKNYLNQIDDLLKKHPNVNLSHIKNSLKEFHFMYAWIYDDSKRYVEWFKVFKNFIEGDEAIVPP